MRKIVEISFDDLNKLICVFDNGEVKLLDLASTLKDRYGKKILSNEAVFKSAQVGEWGEIYWPDLAEITDLNGEKETCNYDISPEYAYAHSKPLSTNIHSVKCESSSD